MRPVRTLLVPAVACVLASVPAAAQERGPLLELGVRGSYLPLYGGDATVGSVANIGWTVQAGVFPTRSASFQVQAFFTHSPENDDPYNRAPRIRLGGLVLKRGVWTSAAAALYLGLGGGRIHVDASELPPCDPAEGCFREGGPNFQDAALNTAIGSIEVAGPSRGRLAAGMDLRLHLPFGETGAMGDSGSPRVEIGVMLGLRI